MAKSNRLRAQTKDLNLQAESHETDAPIIPIRAIEPLKNNGILEWFIKETSKEADFRREEIRKANHRKKKEFYFGFILFIFILLFFLFLSFLILKNSSPYAIFAIPTTVVGGIGVLFAFARKK